MEEGRGNGAPLAVVTLPDGQELRAAVTRRRRDRFGRWWYDLEIPVPDRADDRRHGPQQVTRVIAFSAPFPLVQPIPGEDYRVLDPPAEPQRWLLGAAPASVEAESLVHRRDCAQGAPFRERLRTDREARELLADPTAAVPCPVCRPGAVLYRRPPRA